METEIIVVSVIIPLIIGPLCIFLKSLYDRYNIKNDERKLVISLIFVQVFSFKRSRKYILRKSFTHRVASS